MPLPEAAAALKGQAGTSITVSALLPLARLPAFTMTLTQAVTSIENIHNNLPLNPSAFNSHGFKERHVEKVLSTLKTEQEADNSMGC